MRQWIARQRRRGPRGYDVSTWNVAQINAREGYEGPTSDEPFIQHQLHDLRGALSRMFRNDVELRAAQAAVLASESAVVLATERLGSTASDQIATVEDRCATDSNIAQLIVQRTAASWSRARRRSAEGTLVATRDQLGAAELRLRAAESSAIDRLVDAATVGVESINAYISAFNNAREYDGRPGLAALSGDLIHELVRSAVRPLVIAPE